MAPEKIHDDHIQELADIFRLLGDANRLKVIMTCRDESVAVGDIVKKTGLSQPLVSHHLRLLKAARLLRSEKQGKQARVAFERGVYGGVLEQPVYEALEAGAEGGVGFQQVKKAGREPAFARRRRET